NLVAFSVSCGVVPWLLKSGWEKMWGTVMGICGAVTLLSIPMDLFSSPARRMTAEWRFVNDILHYILGFRIGELGLYLLNQINQITNSSPFTLFCHSKSIVFL